MALVEQSESFLCYPSSYSTDDKPRPNILSEVSSSCPVLTYTILSNPPMWPIIRGMPANTLLFRPPFLDCLLAFQDILLMRKPPRLVERRRRQRESGSRIWSFAMLRGRARGKSWGTSGLFSGAGATRGGGSDQELKCPKKRDRRSCQTRESWLYSRAKISGKNTHICETKAMRRIASEDPNTAAITTAA